MKLFSISNHLTPYLLTACTLLAGVLVYESRNLVQPQGGSDAPLTQAPVNRIERVAYAAPGIATFSEIIERPLFREGREPPAAPVVPVAAAPKTPLRLQLEGIAITPESRIALVRDLSSNKMLHLAAGMKHQGWELTSVTDTVATFTRGTENRDIELKKKTGPAVR